MKEFLNGIWRGQVSPVEDWMGETEEIVEIEGLIARHTAELHKLLGEDGTDILDKLIECDNELRWLRGEQAFACGVRYAVNLFIEALR